MKKLFYILFAVASIAMTVTSCTEEEVQPKTEADNGGGTGSDPVNRN
jgi:hypothetical protein